MSGIKTVSIAHVPVNVAMEYNCEVVNPLSIENAPFPLFVCLKNLNHSQSNPTFQTLWDKLKAKVEQTHTREEAIASISSAVRDKVQTLSDKILPHSNNFLSINPIIQRSAISEPYVLSLLNDSDFYSKDRVRKCNNPTTVAEKIEISEVGAQKFHLMGDKAISKSFNISQFTGYGELEKRSGITYEGSFSGGRPEGYGKKVSKKMTYEGEFHNGKRHGYGKSISKDLTTTYEGQWQNGLKHGLGIEKSPLGTYEGEFENNLIQGYGIFTYANGDKHEGYWREGSCYGSGKKTLQEGALTLEGNWDTNDSGTVRVTDQRQQDCLYVGGWKDGHLEGQGTLTTSAGTCTGIWTVENVEGQIRTSVIGKVTYLDGTTFEGKWTVPHGASAFSQKRFGHGILKTPDMHDSHGEWTIEGEWRNGEIHGPATMTFWNGRVYRGECKGYERDGFGTTTNYPTNLLWETHTGYYRNNTRHGKGILKYRSGDVYEGEFANGKRHGIGKLMDAATGVEKEGRWINDIFQEN